MVVAVAAALALVAVAAVTVTLGRRTAPELARTAEVPVLLVPGYNGTPASLGTLAARLRSAGREVVVVGLPGRGTGDLRASAGVLTAAVDRTGAAAFLDPSLCDGACAQLAPGSALLAELNRGDETPPGPEFFSIWTALDQTVTPPATALLEGAANIRVQDVCPSARLGHGGLVADPLALGLVVGALAGTLPDPPSSGDCAALLAAGAPTR